MAKFNKTAETEQQLRDRIEQSTSRARQMVERRGMDG